MGTYQEYFSFFVLSSNLLRLPIPWSLWHLTFHGTSLLLYKRISFQNAMFGDCILSSMASCYFPCRFMAHPNFLNWSSKGICSIQMRCPKIMSIFSSESYVLVHQRLAGLGTKFHLLASTTKSRNIHSKVFSSVWHDPEVVNPHEVANSMCSFTFEVQDNTNSFPLHSSSTLARIWVVPQTWSLHACRSPRIQTWPCLAAPTFYTKGPQPATHACRGSPKFVPHASVLPHQMPSSSTLLVSRHCHVSRRDSLPPTIPSVFVIDSSPSLVNAGSLSQQLHQNTDSSSFQALLTSPGAE